MIVADTNLVGYLVLNGIHTDQAVAAYERDPMWVVPTLWRSEFLNVLTLVVQSKVLTASQAQSAWHTAVHLVGTLERDPDPLATLDCAIRHRVSAYDAQFVALARQLGVILVTADRKLVRQCPEDAVLLRDFAVGQGPDAREV